jgi:hypothetical protein
MIYFTVENIMEKSNQDLHWEIKSLKKQLSSLRNAINICVDAGDALRILSMCEKLRYDETIELD